MITDEEIKVIKHNEKISNMLSILGFVICLIILSVFALLAFNNNGTPYTTTTHQITEKSSEEVCTIAGEKANCTTYFYLHFGEERYNVKWEYWNKVEINMEVSVRRR